MKNVNDIVQQHQRVMSNIACDNVSPFVGKMTAVKTLELFDGVLKLGSISNTRYDLCPFTAYCYIVWQGT